MNGDEDSDPGAALLAGAYALETPDQHVAYYRDFAQHYDQTFADGLGYVYPLAIAAALEGVTLPDGGFSILGAPGLSPVPSLRVVPMPLSMVSISRPRWSPRRPRRMSMPI